MIHDAATASIVIYADKPGATQGYEYPATLEPIEMDSDLVRIEVFPEMVRSHVGIPECGPGPVIELDLSVSAARHLAESLAIAALKAECPRARVLREGRA